MSDAFTGEIRLFCGNFVPENWAACDGTILPTAAYTPLCSVIGTLYGGDGKTTFALPNLNGQVPLHQGQSLSQNPLHKIGESGGEAAVTLLPGNMPAHTHLAMASNQGGTANSPANALWAVQLESGGRNPQPQKQYAPAQQTDTMAQTALQLAGGGTAHNNMQPYLSLRYIICLIGDYPLRPDS